MIRTPKRTTVLWIALALAGLVVAVAVSYAASQLSKPRIGLASEPASAGAGLTPKPEHNAASGSHGATRTTTTPTSTTPTVTTPVVTTPVATTPTVTPTRALPTHTTTPPTRDDSGGPGADDSGGGRAGGGGSGGDD